MNLDHEYCPTTISATADLVGVVINYDMAPGDMPLAAVPIVAVGLMTRFDPRTSKLRHDYAEPCYWVCASGALGIHTSFVGWVGVYPAGVDLDKVWREKRKDIDKRIEQWNSPIGKPKTDGAPA